MTTGTNDLITLKDVRVHYRSGGGLFSHAKTVKAVDA